MCQKAEPVISGTIRKLVNTGIHLVCVFFDTLRDSPVTVAQSKPERSILAYFISLAVQAHT